MNRENGFLFLLGKLTDSILLNLIFVLSCLPVVTIGISCTSVYYTVHKVLRQDRGYLWGEYQRAWRENFKQAGSCWLFFAIIEMVLGVDTYIMYQVFRAGYAYGSIYIFFIVLFVLTILWMIYTFAYMARFVDTTKETLKNSAFMMILHFPKTLLLLAILGAAMFLVWLLPLFVLIVPILVVWFGEILLESIFVNYMAEEDRKAEQKRSGKNY
ncbi:MAG: YesL family protein [Lachnospiraceae bacterium]|nr:YesL family protein [Lachnospiraceae bacterium]